MVATVRGKRRSRRRADAAGCDASDQQSATSVSLAVVGVALAAFSSDWSVSFWSFGESLTAAATSTVSATSTAASKKSK